MPIDRIALIGTGFVGGSLGLAWKRAVPGCTITGLDAPAVLDEAAARSAIDERAASMEAAVREADLVVLATPLPTIVRLLQEMAPHLPPQAVVTDVGAVKAPVLAQARSVLPDANSFVGGHPVLAPQRHGTAAADASLFEGAPYVLCGPDDEPEDALRAAHSDLFHLIEAAGAVPLVMSAAAHDRALAAARQLPQFLTAALAEVRGGSSERDPAESAAIEALAAAFFRAPANSPPAAEAWREEAIGNQGPLLDVLARFASALQRLRNRLIEEDAEALEHIARPPSAAGE